MMPDAGVNPVYPPEKSRSELLIAAAVFTLSCLYFCLFYSYTIFDADEGIILQGAQRILNGEVLYRDFFSFFTPGSYYWTALLFKVFGDSILVPRAALIVYGGIFPVLTYLLARRVCSRWNAVLAIFPIVVMCLPYRFSVLHNWDSTLFALLALYCAVRFIERPRWGWAFSLGSLTAITCLFEQSKGAGLVIGLALGAVILGVSGCLRLWAHRRSVIALAFGLVWPFLLTMAYFGAHRALGQMVSDVLWPLHHYSVLNRVPYGYVERDWVDLFHGSLGWRALSFVTVSPLFLVSSLPVFAVCALALSTALLWKQPMANGRTGYYVLVSAALTGLLIGTLATSRADVGHIVFVVPFFSLLLAWMSEAAKTPFLRLSKGLAVGYVMVSFAALGLAFLLSANGASYRLETRRGTLRTPVQYDAFKYMQSRIPAGEKILVYPYQPLVHYLTGTYSITRYDWIFPGMYNAAEFGEIIADLEASRPRVVLFYLLSWNEILGGCPNFPIQVAAARDPVFDYLIRRYHPCRSLAANSLQCYIVFMVRNDLPCSLGSGNPVEH